MPRARLCVRSDTGQASNCPTFAFPTVYGNRPNGQNAGVPWPPDLFHAGDAVRKLRRRRKLSQTKLAALAGVARSTVQAFERQPATASAPTRDRLARALDVDPSDLAGPLVVMPSARTADDADATPMATEVSSRTQERARNHAAERHTVQRSLASPPVERGESRTETGEHPGPPPTPEEVPLMPHHGEAWLRYMQARMPDPRQFQRWMDRASALATEMAEQERGDTEDPQAAGGEGFPP